MKDKKRITRDESAEMSAWVLLVCASIAAAIVLPAIIGIMTAGL